jgi:hypothetical protein
MCDRIFMYGRISFLRNTKRVDDISEARVIAALVEAGFQLLLPFGENHRYDIAIDFEGKFYRVQVKSGRVRGGVVEFNCYSSHTHRGGSSCRRYIGEIDFFGVYCAQLGKTYLVPLEDVGSSGSLRIKPCENSQKKKIRWAEPYVIPGPGTKLVGPRPVGGVSLGGLLPP